MEPTIILFAKAPEAGGVKTRLAAGIGADAALDVYRWLTTRQLSALPAKWSVVVRFAPAHAEKAMREWLGEHLTLLPQCDGDLGERLDQATREAFEAGAREVFLVGADCPTLSASQLEEGQVKLAADADVVFGPTEDGGYYLLAMRRYSPELFRNIRWSTAHTLPDSIAAAEQVGLRVQLLERLSDIDTLDDFQQAVEKGWIPVEVARDVLPV